MTTPIITRASARTHGLTYYFTGKACKRGHVAKRNTRNLTCVECDVAAQRRRYLENPDRDSRNAIAKKSYQRCKDHRAAYRKQWAADNPDYFRERWASLPTEQRKAKKQAWYAANRERAIRYTAEWVAANPERAKENAVACQSRRRARKQEVGGRHTAAETRALLASQGHRCVYCRADLRVVNKNLDHVLPIALGGADDIANLQWLCPPCNLAKAAQHPVEFARKIGRLV